MCGSGSSSACEKRILLVDDQPRAIEGLKRDLEAAGFSVVCVRTLNQAWREIENSRDQRPFDLLITDLYLPFDLSELESYRSDIKEGPFNQGEMLAAYLQGKGIPYFFYTSDESFYRGNEKHKVFMKSESREALLEKIKETVWERAD